MSDVKSRIKQENWITYGLTDSSDYNLKTFEFKNDNLIGEFNDYNVLAAAATCEALGLKRESIKKSIETFHAPIGRAD